MLCVRLLDSRGVYKLIPYLPTLLDTKMCYSLVCDARESILRLSVKANAEEAIATGKAAEKDAKAARAEAKKAEADAKKAETARKKAEAAAEAAQSAAETARSEAEKLRLEKAAVEVRLAGTQQALTDAGMQTCSSSILCYPTHVCEMSIVSLTF
jgi:hypothetical protein